MDLQSARMRSGRWSIPKLTVLICFALACALLIGSLLSDSHAATGHEAIRSPAVLKS